jgi:hypothetical protein
LMPFLDTSLIDRWEENGWSREKPRDHRPGACVAQSMQTE